MKTKHKKKTPANSVTKLHQWCIQKINFIPVLHHLTEISTKSVNATIKLNLIQCINTDDTLSYVYTKAHISIHHSIHTTNLNNMKK